MKFVIKQAAQQEPEEKTVEASLEVGWGGDLMLNINGTPLLWINTDGILYRNPLCKAPWSHSGLGFLSNSSGQICTVDEKAEIEGSYK